MAHDLGWTQIGQSQPRQEDERLVTGRGAYAGDEHVEHELWLHVIRSDYAAGQISALDVSDARNAPGVVEVLTAKDQVGMRPFALRFQPPGTELIPTPFLPLASDAVRWVGEPVAAIVATSREAALDAADLVLLEVEDAPVVTEARQGAADDAPRVWADRPNVGFEQELGDRSAFDAACEEAAHIVTARIEITRVAAVAMEPRNALAMPLDDGRLLLRTGTQAPHRVRDEVTNVLAAEPGSIVVEAKDTGGSFGMRNGAYPEDVLVLLAARKTGRPVRWRATRSDSFLSDTQSREMSVDATLALDADGRFLGLSLDGYAPIGAQHGPMATHPMTSNLPGVVGVYRTPILHTVMRGVHVNTMHMAPYRGAGRPEAIYLMERMVDIAANQIGADPAELRRINMIATEEMPYQTPLGHLYDSGDFPKALDTALKAADWDGFAARRAISETRNKLRGIGLAAAIEPAGGGPKGAQLPEFSRIEVGPDTGLSLTVGSGDTGQGHATVFRQMTASLLGWQGEMSVTASNTDKVPKGVGTFGSRTMAAAGHSMSDTSAQIIEAARADAARHLDAPGDEITFEDGAFRAEGTNRFVSLQDLVRATGATYRAESFVPTEAGTFPNSCHLVEVEIDRDTGAVQVVAYTVVDDVGRVINPMLVEGQVHGGIAQGLGQALGEKLTFDAGSGALVSGSFMDYTMPRAADLPMIDVHHSPTLTRVNALGVKGAGESGTVGSLAAVMNAVCNALTHAGAQPIDMPASPQRVWAALAGKETS